MCFCSFFKSARQTPFDEKIYFFALDTSFPACLGGAGLCLVAFLTLHFQQKESESPDLLVSCFSPLLNVFVEEMLLQMLRVFCEENRSETWLFASVSVKERSKRRFVQVESLTLIESTVIVRHMSLRVYWWFYNRDVFGLQRT